jgi:hypothetical protein
MSTLIVASKPEKVASLLLVLLVSTASVCRAEAMDTEPSHNQSSKELTLQDFLGLDEARRRWYAMVSIIL